ncbi:jg1256 [Pararge aegeria aegeria]|uniref:Jg1256 protein n=1 Tax=Pararge aegeria aegeria TaxID=348720 RepID=A0A8S4R1G2_9NEOP|nr:jg1256 [Pararge aegeria aegeria]
MKPTPPTWLQAAAVADDREPVLAAGAEHLVGVQPAHALVAAHAGPAAQHLHALRPTHQWQLIQNSDL